MSTVRSQPKVKFNPFGWMTEQMVAAFRERATITDQLVRTPVNWLRYALSTKGGVWFSGEVGPPSTGNYERFFVDGVIIQQWDGETWWSKGASMPHWRQIGDYPCWRPCSTTLKSNES